MPRIALAAVAGAHGIKGEVRLKLFGQGADSLSRHQTLFLGGTERRLLSAKDAGKGAIARFEGISDRSAAEAAVLRTLIEAAEPSSIEPAWLLPLGRCRAILSRRHFPSQQRHQTSRQRDPASRKGHGDSRKRPWRSRKAELASRKGHQPSR